MNKRFFIILFFVLVTLGLGVVFSLKSKPFPKTITPVVHYAAPPPKISVVPNAPTNTTVSFTGAVSAFPASLSTYHYEYHNYSDNEKGEIALNLGFSAPPIKLSYGEEKRTVWKNATATLLFVQNGVSQYWSYLLFRSSPTTHPAQSLSALAKIMLEKSFFSYGAALLPLNTVSQPIEHMQIAESPRPLLSNYFFAVRAGDYPIYSSIFTLSYVVIVMDEYGAARYVSFISQPNLVPEKSVPLISVDDAVASINKGLGILVAVTKNGDSYWEKTPQFKSASLSDIQLIYYPNQESSLLTPFYLFRGTAQTTEGVVVDVVYTVSATE